MRGGGGGIVSAESVENIGSGLREAELIRDIVLPGLL
jgi:hypothetical protein